MAKPRITVTRATVLVAAAIAIGLMFSTAAMAADSRGVEVKVRTSEATNAPVADIVQLYGASHALVIGIDKYTNGWSRLSKAVEDARVVAKELERQGFQVTLKTDLKADALRTTLREFFAIKGADPDARLLLWYAGHGDTIGGEGYLVPADAPPDNSPAFLVRALPMRDFGSLVRLAQSKHVLSVFDSCFSGTIFQARAGTTPRAITKKTTKPVRQFVTSGDAGQQVRDDGSFREYFVRALRGEDKADFNADGYVTGEELGLFLNQQMSALTSAAQTPKSGKLHDVRFNQGDFVFVLPHRKLPPLLPGPIATVPLSDGGFDLGELEQRASAEEKSRAEWSSWQQSMASAFGTVEKYVQRRISPELKVAALDKFLRAFEQNNPYSSDDEALREKTAELKASKAPVAAGPLAPDPPPATAALIKALNTALEASENKNKDYEQKIGKLDARLAEALAGKIEEMARYRSEFYGRMLRVLGNRRDIRIVGDRFVFRFKVLFGSGEAVLGRDGMGQLEQFAQTLSEVAATIPTDIDWVLRVDGHTDRTPIHNEQFASNWELSTARAVSVVKFLISRGIPAKRLVAAGFGQFHPLDARKEKLGYSRNRHIEFRLDQK